MNDHREFANDELPDEGLLKKLSGLLSGAPRGSMDRPGEEKLIQELRRRSRRKSGLTGFWGETLCGPWEPVLLSLLFALLSWDLLRIIRLLLR